MKNLKTIGIIGIILFLSVSIFAFPTTKKGNAQPKKQVTTKKTTSSNTVTDIDGNVYKTVKIGNQVWMAENLKVTHYQNGNVIDNVTRNDEWKNLSAGAWCDYNNSSSNGNNYGHLYNWYAVSDNRNIAPKGWHVPTDEEWKILTNYLGGENVAGGKLKQTGMNNWASPNEGATNETGFSALPGGYLAKGMFKFVGNNGHWWSSNESCTSNAWIRILYFFSCGVGMGMNYDTGKTDGLSVRCIRDYTMNVQEKTDNTSTGIISDIDGNTYKTVTIGTQTWMAENMRTTRYRNGDDIINVTSSDTWPKLIIGAWCDYDNLPANGYKYGHLYNWCAVSDNRNIAPVGWHVPSDAEWTTLINYLGGKDVAGGKLKEAGMKNWKRPNKGATNETGFSALPCGIRDFNGKLFSYEGVFTYWWSSSECCSASGAIHWSLSSSFSFVDSNGTKKMDGLSVRCIKD